jgi:hypothetical protein
MKLRAGLLNQHACHACQVLAADRQVHQASRLRLQVSVASLVASRHTLWNAEGRWGCHAVRQAAK